MTSKIWIVLTAGFLIRFIALDQSFWLDEAATANVVKYYSFGEIIRRFSPTDFHPPLYYLLLKSWGFIFGTSEIVLRFPSLLFSLLSGWIVYLIGKRLKNERFGFWAAAFFLFNPLIVYYSQEARMYMMAVFFLTLAVYYLIKNLKIKNQNDNAKLKKILGLNAGLIFALFTFYGSIFFSAAVLFYLLSQKKYRKSLILCLTTFVFLLLLSPLMFQQFNHAREQLLVVPHWGEVLGKVNLKNLALIPVKFAFGRISFYPKSIYYPVAGLWTAFVWFAAARGTMKKKRLGFLLIAPLVLGLIFSFISPLLQYFRFLYLLPVFSLLLGYGVYRSRLKFIILLGFIVLSLFYLFHPALHREDWRSLAKDVVKYKKAYMIYSSSDPIKYYRPDMLVKDLSELNTVVDSKVIVIPYSAEIHGVDYKKILQDKNYRLVKEKSVRLVKFEEWVF